MFWKCNVSEDIMTLKVRVFIHRERNGELEILHDDGTITTDETGGTDVKPTFSIPRSCLKDLLEGLANLGVKPKDEGFIVGELKGTKYHLEDLRVLLKLTKKNNTISKK